MISGDTYGILNRLLLNQHIEPSPEGILRILGFVHVYTASGLHLIALESFLQRFFGRSLKSKKILTVFFWFFLFLLWKLQGFRLGFARILVLFFLRSLARSKGYRWRVYYPLFLAFCFDFALGIDSGWQHYYLAILGGMLGLEIAKNRGTMMQHWYLSVASWLMTAPLDLIHHHTISWMTPFWSMITIPVISIFLYPLSVITYLLLDRIPLFIVNFWNIGVEFSLSLVDLGLTFSVVTEKTMLISFIVAIMTVFMKKKSVLVLFLILMFTIRSDQRSVELIQLSVGQGDSLLVLKNQRVEMIDLGTSHEVKPEKIITRLSKYGVTHVDTVLFSHLDEDHAGGVRLLLPWVKTTQLEVNSRFDRTMKLQHWLEDFPRTQWCEVGCFRSGSVNWIQNGRSVKGNNLMATVMIPLSENEIYLALGDSNAKQEDEFWNQNHQRLMEFRYRILKISHHGSKNSTKLDFLRKINPAQAVVSVGRRNHFHHPHFSVMNLLHQVRIPIHRTDRQGDYVFKH